jgi:hypothetical protein
MPDKRTLTVTVRAQELSINVLEKIGPSPVNLLSAENTPVSVWLTPPMFSMLTKTLKENGCSDSDVRQVYEMLIAGKDATIELAVPDIGSR